MDTGDLEADHAWLSGADSNGTPRWQDAAPIPTLEELQAASTAFHSLTYRGGTIRANGTDTATIEITGEPSATVNLKIDGLADAVTLDGDGRFELVVKTAISHTIKIEATDPEYNDAVAFVEAV